MNLPWRLRLQLVFASLLLASMSAVSSGDPYINEIYFDPPGSGGDNSQEYIELRGTPGASLNNHYLILLESENTETDSGNPGQVDFIVDLNGRSFSPSGFFSLRQRNSPYTSVPNNTFNPINTLGSGTSNGWGSTLGVDNNIGVQNSALYSTEPGKIENSGFTAMLIRVNGGGTAPILGQTLDGSVDNDGNSVATDHDGLDYPNGVADLSPNNPAWTILDSVGIFSEGTGGTSIGEAVYGRTYAKINFGPEIPGQTYSYFDPSQGQDVSVTFQPNITPGQTYVGLGYEVEHIARWGNMTGETAADWHITNDTNNALSGFSSTADGFRQSGRYHDNPNDDFVETNQFVPYGANLTNTIGAANYPANLAHLPWDYNSNGIVDAADYVIWRKTIGQTTGSSSSDLPADGNGGKKIEEDDFTFWRARFGYTLGGPGAGSSFDVGGTAVPEPACWMLSLAAMAVVLVIRHRSRS